MSKEIITNVFSVDVEDWFHVFYLKDKINSEDWELCNGVVSKGVSRILKILNEHNTSATFFVLGWVAEHYPEVIEKIYEEGHEIASHGYSHNLVTELNPAEFSLDLKKSIDIIERTSHSKVLGYRAPLGSINKETLWFFDELVKQGIKYDSSIYPTKSLVFSGLDGFPRKAHYVKEGLIEVPLSVTKFLSLDLPLSGGFYLRSLPFPLYKHCIQKENKNGNPVVIYIHPWELELSYPRLINSPIMHFIQYHKLNTVEKKIKHLLKEFNFSSVQKVFFR